MFKYLSLLEWRLGNPRINNYYINVSVYFSLLKNTHKKYIYLIYFLILVIMISKKKEMWLSLEECNTHTSLGIMAYLHKKKYGCVVSTGLLVLATFCIITPCTNWLFFVGKVRTIFKNISPTITLHTKELSESNKLKWW